VAAETYIAYADVAKVESQKPRTGTNVVFGFERGGGHKTIEKELMEFVYTKNDQLDANKKEAKELKNELRSRKSNILLGTDDRQYMTTSGATFTAPKDGRAGVLAASVKKDLRATHYILGDNKTDYMTSTGAAHVPYSVLNDFKPVENSKGTTSVVIGSGVRDGMPPQSVAQISYGWPAEKLKNF
jgi:hypothetical protein